jgi:hypothetical protein
MAEKLKFKHGTEVHQYAIKQGYDMGLSKMNSVLAKKLKGISKKDGYWFQDDIDNLLRFGRFKQLSGAMPADVAILDRKIKEADLREKEGKAIKVERENAKAAGQLIERSKMHRELVARMIQLRKDEKTDNKVKAAEIIAKIGGDIEQEKVLIKLLNSLTDKRLNRYAQPFRFAVSMSEIEKEIALIEAEDDADSN